MDESARSRSPLQAHLEKQKAAIVARWKRTLREDPSIPETERMSEPQLTDDVPKFIDELIESLGDPSGSTANEQTRVAGEHARQRFGQGCSLESSLREWRHLRSTIVRVAHEGPTPPTVDELAFLHATLDEAMTAVAVQMEEAANALGSASEDRYREATEHLRAVLDTAVDGIMTIDERGTIQSANPATSKMFGYGQEELLGRNVKMLMPEPYRSEHDGYLEAYRRTRVPKVIGTGREVAGMRKDGTSFPLELAVSEVNVRAGRYFTGIVRDVTARKEAERDRERALAQLEGEVEFRDRFMAILGHDLKNPLQTIVAGSSNLLFQDVPEWTARTLRRIANSAQRMGRMIDDLLDLSRVQQGGGIPIDPRPMKLEPVVAQVIEELETTRPNRRAAFLADGACAGVWDPDRLAQVVSNLLCNAFDYSPEGTDVRVRLIEDRDRVVLEVTNDAEPIPPELAARIFDPFTRATSTKRNRGGLGLGLFIVRQIVEGHGGRVSVRADDSGTTFSVDLPREAKP